MPARIAAARSAAARNLSHLLRLVAIVGASAVTLTMLAVTWQLADRFDAEARVNTVRMVEGGVQALRNANKLVARDYAYWTDAYLAVARNDLDWLDSNIGAGAYATGSMDVVVVAGGALAGPLGWTADGIDDLDPDALAAFATLAQDLVAAQDHPVNATPVGTLAEIDGRLWMISTDWIQPQTEGAGVEGPLALLVSALLIDQDDADELGRLFLIDRITFDRVAGADRDHVLLSGTDGPLARFHWPSPRPGRATLLAFAPPLALAVLVAVIAVVMGFAAISRLAARLERALVAAEAADRTKAEFIAGLSHELRTPMNGILGMLELLQTGPLDRDQTEYVRIALASAETQVEMIDHLLAFGRIESGNMQLSSAPFLPAETLSEVVALAGPTARGKGVALNLATNGPQGLPVHGDRLAFRQIAVNLIGNAIKFTAEGRVEVSLSILPGLDGTRLRLAVADTGPGIPASEQDRIFESFVQADGSAARRAGGVGLGLAISRRLAVQMGGSLTVDSTPGQGSVFLLDLCLDSSDAPESRPRAA